MKFVPDYLEQVDLSEIKPLPVWQKVYSQAVQHTRRLDSLELLKVNRPNESDRIKEYRNKIARRITREGVYKFIAKKSRIYKNSGVNIDRESISETLENWLMEKPFNVNGRQLTFEEYIYEVVSIYTLEDPNALHIAFPVNPKDQKINPSADPESGGARSDEPIGIYPLIIPSEQRRVLTENIVAWEHGKWTFGDQDQYEAPYYFLGDSESWYIYVPNEMRNGRPYYELIKWYDHKTGELPAQVLPGFMSLSPEGEKYQESFIGAYYEYADEFVTAFSDSQAVRVQHSYPKVVMEDLPCPANCRNGKTFTIGEDGKEIIGTCQVCKGTGVINDIGPYSVLRKPAHAVGKPETPSSKPVEYLQMPSESLKFGHEVAFELLDKGKRAIGLDLLESLAESGKAKEARLEDLIDYLVMVGNAEVRFMETFLYHCESLLQINPESRIRPKVKRPENYSIKTPQMLLEEVQTSIPSDRVQKSREYFKAAYKGQDKLIRVLSLAHDYAPLLGLEGTELQTRLNFAYEPNDLIKADRAVWAFHKIAEDQENFMLMEDDDLFKLADDLIEPFLQKSNVDGEGGPAGGSGIDAEIAAATTSEQLPRNVNTSEKGLTAYIRGQISRDSAIKILMINEGDTEEEAAYEVDNLSTQD